MLNLILETILTKHVSTAEVADALGKTGVMSGISSLNSGHFVAAEAFYICTWGNSNWSLHEQAQQIPPGHIVYVDTINCGDQAILGDLVARWLLIHQKSTGVIVNGLVRDVHRLRKEDYPIWCTGYTPLGCSNERVECSSSTDSYIKSQNKKFDGAILVADDSGCALIRSEFQNQDLLDRINFIKLQEDIRYFCTDKLKMSTYETVCLKRYLREVDLLPQELQASLQSFSIS
ncbi:isocitrate/isopropylmalate dehydrogenase family protein [cyanobiont of Ornithocercus magnificus]|nr:isocitrate/isopropylmalate dehydrogenase family protein [cyanobiont of Ornithocercus magnificus]